MLEEIIIRMKDDHPGILAEVGELLGSHDVNIETLAASTHLGEGVIHVVVDDGEDAGEILKSNGFTVDGVRPVLTTTLDDKPGEFGAYCRRLVDAGIDVDAVYVARKGNGETEMIFAVDDLDAAQRA
jgi:hypothetical protein